MKVLVYFLKESLRKSPINYPGARSAPRKMKVLEYFLKEIVRKSLLNHPGAPSAPGNKLRFLCISLRKH